MRVGIIDVYEPKPISCFLFLQSFPPIIKHLIQDFLNGESSDMLVASDFNDVCFSSTQLKLNRFPYKKGANC